MNISKPFILRPIGTSLVMVAIMMVGLLAYKLLPVASLPEMSYPDIEVTTFYPGASPDLMASNVTAPLEKQFGQMPSLLDLSSISSAGVSVINLRFSADLSIDVAEQQVQAAIQNASSLLPNDLPSPPIYNKINPADAPILTLAITSPTLSIIELNNLVENRLATKLSQVSGVGLVALAGGQRPAIRVQINPTKLASLEMTLDDVRNSINSANVKGAKGNFDGPLRTSSIDSNDQLQTIEDYKNIILAYKNGSTIRLSQVANIIEGAENDKLAAWVGIAKENQQNLSSGILLNIRRQPSANVIETVDKIKKLLPELQEQLPVSVDLQILTDRTKTIRASVTDIQKELILAVFLVVAVIFVFLRSFSATLIPSFAVPLSLVGTFAVMNLLGFSINNLTLMALTVATGFVVDDAIVMIENISRYVEEGENPLIAALKGAKQIGFTIISLTISLIAVLIPILFMTDIIGQLFHEFAVTMVIAILISAFISLTFTPMLCGKLLKNKKNEKKNHVKIYYLIGNFFDDLIKIYSKYLDLALNHSKTIWSIFLSTLALTTYLYIFMNKGFFPTQDSGILQATTEADSAISFPAMFDKQQKLAEELLQDKSIESISSFIGVDSNNPTLNSGKLLINLKPHNQRENLQIISQRLIEISQKIAGIELFIQPVQDLTIEDKVSKTSYQLLLSTPDQKELEKANEILLSEMQNLPFLVDVSSNLQNKGKQIFIEIDRTLASRLGVNISAINNALYNSFGQRLISTVFNQSNIYRVILEIEPNFRLNPKSLENVFVASTNSSKPIQLSNFAKFSENLTNLSINRSDQMPASTISFNINSSLGEAIKSIEDLIENLRKENKLSFLVDTNFQGVALAFQNSLTNTLFLVLAAIITMYIVLGVLYESLIHPITILSTLPSAGVGALLSLKLFGLDLDVIAIIGIILLIGIVKKNAIMMIDFALEAQREQNLSAKKAIFQASLLRFRPILMTTLAALLGALPLMLSTGVGSELRQPLGVALVGGLILSQILTLFTTPVIYLTFENWKQNYVNRKSRKN